MTVMTEDAPSLETEVGGLLRRWRERRRLSQLEISNRTGVSTRHLSRVETGRAKPTAEMILRLADDLDVPLAERNNLLLAGGFAPRYGGRALDHADLGSVMAGLRSLLDAHAPWPALLLDGHWNVIDYNEPVGALLAACDPSLLEPPVNVVRLSVHPLGLAPQIRNLQEWAAHLHQLVSRRAEANHDAVLYALADEIRQYVDLPSVHIERNLGPVLALELGDPADSSTPPLRFFTVAATLETFREATLEGIQLETFLPADASTATRLSTP